MPRARTRRRTACRRTHGRDLRARRSRLPTAAGRGPFHAARPRRTRPTRVDQAACATRRATGPDPIARPATRARPRAPSPARHPWTPSCRTRVRAAVGACTNARRPGTRGLRPPRSTTGTHASPTTHLHMSGPLRRVGAPSGRCRRRSRVRHRNARSPPPRAVADPAATIIGIDVTAEMLTAACAHGRDGADALVLGDVLAPPLRPGRVDTILVGRPRRARPRPCAAPDRPRRVGGGRAAGLRYSIRSAAPHCGVRAPRALVRGPPRSRQRAPAARARAGFRISSTTPISGISSSHTPKGDAASASRTSCTPTGSTRTRRASSSTT